ncbi:hypothetical protein BKA63DRAFT_412497, partial [Paraphoma chrysanthemicola]
STARNAASSPLLRLPVELRNKIYAYVLTGNYPYPFNVMNSTMDPPKQGEVSQAIRIMKEEPHPLALLSCCRQVHADAKLLPFELNVFEFEVLGRLASNSEKVAAVLLPFQRAAITRICTSDYNMPVDADYIFGDMKDLGLTCARTLLPRLTSAALTYSDRCLAFEKYRKEIKLHFVAWLKGDSEEVQVTEEGPDGVLRIL